MTRRTRTPKRGDKVFYCGRPAMITRINTPEEFPMQGNRTDANVAYETTSGQRGSARHVTLDTITPRTTESKFDTYWTNAYGTKEGN